MMKSLIHLVVLACMLTGVTACEPESGGEEVLVKPAPGVDPSVLEQKEFEVEPLIGEFKADSGQVLSIGSKGEAVLKESEGDDSAIVFAGKWDRTFDGIHVAITKVRDESREAEIYLRVKDQGYELKDMRLMEGVDLPKSYLESDKQP